MSYLVFARKYRPQTFDELVGQEPIATTLKNAIETDRAPHAFLFTGPRGVGKTSMARILAKSLNCEKGPTVNPCGKCSLCDEITKGSSLDVIEIDGASNRGIDDIRQLREGAQFVPVRAKYKVYIIDEVHQITQDAFNALLKMLEEPPRHLKFIFATTEPQKIPLTILSRCQRFDFRRIKSHVIVETIRDICRKEKIQIEEDALFVIARFADGSLRDAQSLLDQLISFSSAKITKTDVLNLLGAVTDDQYFGLLSEIHLKEGPKALIRLRQIYDQGADLPRFFTDLVMFLRDLIVVKAVEDQEDLKKMELHPEYVERIKKTTDLFTQHELFYIFHVIKVLAEDIRRAQDVMVVSEIAVLRLIAMPKSATVDELLTLLKKQGAKGVSAHARQEEVAQAPLSNPDLPQPQSNPSSNATDEEKIEKMLRLVKEKSITVGLNLSKAGKIMIEGNKLLFGFRTRDMFHKEIVNKNESREVIGAVAKGIYGRDLQVGFFDLEKKPDSSVKDRNQELKTSAKQVLNDPSVQGIINTFDAEIINIERARP